MDIIDRLRIEAKREPYETIWRDAITEIERLRKFLLDSGDGVCAMTQEEINQLMWDSLPAWRREQLRAERETMTERDHPNAKAQQAAPRRLCDEAEYQSEHRMLHGDDSA